MQEINWDPMSTEDIRKHIADAQAIVQQREEVERQKVLKDMRKLAESVGLSFELIDETSKRKKARRKSSKKAPPKDALPPKYQNPDNPEETWTGRGRRPSFIRAVEERGEDIEQLRIEDTA